MPDNAQESPSPAAKPASGLHLGAAYYPEQWPEERWPEDIRLMQEAGFTVARLGEFAWSTFEPSEGDFHFDWMERAIALLAEAGIQTVMGTPTAAPPAWLVGQYPETLTLGEDGQRVQFGNRCHYCVNSPTFHQLTQKIVSAMGEQFGQNPNVIGWQLDNEYSMVCYCEVCQKRFQDFLQERYGSLDNLNARWSTAYWSQTYSDWSQIPIPIGGHNPGLMLEFKRFVTDSYRRFQLVQLEALRPHLPEGVWVTHNFMGWFDGFDHYTLNQDLDMASWDYYVGTGYHDHTRHGAAHDLTRGFKRRNFWVMETQPGSVNWSRVNNMLRRGEARAMAWQAVGHGADGILYWQWRSALGGQEQYHGTLVDQSGQPRPFYQEAQKLGRDFNAVRDLLQDSQPVKARIAILNDYESRWSLQWQKHHQDFDYVQHLLTYYRPLAAQNFPIDIVHADAPLDDYKVVIVPSLVILSEERANKLTEFVHKGGYVVITPRSGVKDEYNALLPSRQPGMLKELTGVEVEEYYALPEPVGINANWFQGQGSLWAERLKITTNQQLSVIGRYTAYNGWLDDQIAITVRGYGYGLVYYVGTILDDASMVEFIKRMLIMSHVVPNLETPPGLEACKRIRPDGQEVFILINHEPEIHKISLPWPADEHISGQRLASSARLAPFGVAVLTKAPPEPETEAEEEAGLEPGQETGEPPESTSEQEAAPQANGEETAPEPEKPPTSDEPER
jgi:beta-galactosidase